MEFDEGSLALFFVFIKVCDFWVAVGVLLVFEGEVVHSVIFVEAAVFDTFNHLLRVKVILAIDDLNDRVLHHYVLALEVNEVSPAWFVGQAELACS